MKLEQNDKSLLFSNTEIPDVFFTEYFSQSNGDYIKIYLYMLFLSKYNKEIKVTDLSKKLALVPKVIQDAIKHWETLGVITKKGNGYVMNNIQEIELYKLYNPKLTSSAKDIEDTAKNKYRAKAIEEINITCFQGVMSPSWYNDIDLWFKKYNFDEHVMIALFKYCLERSALHRNYIQVVAEAWHQNNIETFTDLDLYYQKQEKFNSVKKTIAKKLGYTRPFTEYEIAYIEKWYVSYGYGLEVIEIALKKTTSKSNPNFDYLDKLITDWHERNLKTTEHIQKYLIEATKKSKEISKIKNDQSHSSPKKNSYNQYDQRTQNNLNDLYKDARQALNE